MPLTGSRGCTSVAFMLAATLLMYTHQKGCSAATWKMSWNVGLHTIGLKTTLKPALSQAVHCKTHVQLKLWVMTQD